ncbi:MAG: hypothetical protein PVS3B3_37670 [Ktedonobacteraceae bacterium]
MLFLLDSLISSFGDSITVLGLRGMSCAAGNSPLDVGFTFLIFSCRAFFLV